MKRSKEWWNCALDRAGRTVAQTLVGTIPAGFVITPTMLKEADITIVYVIIAWVLTGLLTGLNSILTSYFKGIPEVDGE